MFGYAMIVKVEIIGVEPPCQRCKKTKENVDKVAEKLKAEGIDVQVTKLDVMAKETRDKFGLVRTPGLSINGTMKIMGKIPDPGVIERLIHREL
jgi:hypothetical protein